MGWQGAWQGATIVEVPAEEDEDEVLTPVPVPIVFGDDEYFDHVTRALDRLCQQFRSSSFEDDDD